MENMTAEREGAILERAVETYGKAAQVDMMLEEMSELTKALLKHRRNASPKTLANIREEMADVQIMLNQMELIFGDFTEEEIAKLERLDKRLATGTNEAMLHG